MSLEKAAFICCRHSCVEADRAPLLLALRAALLRVEMIMTRDTGDDLAFAGDAEALLI